MIQNGLQIIENPYMPEFVQVPVRKLEQKPWMIKNGCYWSRVQKKWNKRFGFTTERQILSDGTRLFMHPKTALFVKTNIKVL